MRVFTVANEQEYITTIILLWNINQFQGSSKLNLRNQLIQRQMPTNKNYSYHSHKGCVSPQVQTSQSIKKELEKIKMYFERDNWLPSSLNSQNDQLTPYLPSPPQSNSQYLDNCAQKINDQIVSQNKRLKDKLKRQKSYRKQINQTLKQQNQILQSLSNNLIPMPPQETVKSHQKQAKQFTCQFHEIFTCQKPKIQQSRQLLRKLSRESQKQYKMQEITNLNKHYSQTKSASKKSLDQEVPEKKKRRKCSYQPSLTPSPSLMASPQPLIQQSKQPSTLISPSISQTNSQKSVKGSLFSDEKLLQLLSHKMLFLMRKSQQEQSRTEKLKIRQEIGEVITQIKNLKQLLEHSERPTKKPYTYDCKRKNTDGSISKC